MPSISSWRDRSDDSPAFIKMSLTLFFRDIISARKANAGERAYYHENEA
jgi:hypothetical protein